MKWLRANAKRLSLLALFSLALQLGLSFGHVHHDRALASTSVSDQTSAPSRDHGGDAGGGHDLCAICATVALAHALIDAAPPVLPVPVVTATADIPPVTIASSAIAQPLGFHSRAPPLI